MSDTMNPELNDLHKAANGEEKAEQTWANDGGAGNSVNNPTQDLEALRAKNAELEDQYKRLWADQQNMLKRTQKERMDLLKYAASGTIEAILPALDNFEFAKRSITPNTSFEDIIKSISMLQEQFLMSLQSIGLSEIETNIPYNPELHEAVSKVQDPTKAEGSIAEVVKKGFKLNDKVLRVATVVVTSKDA